MCTKIHWEMYSGCPSNKCTANVVVLDIGANLGIFTAMSASHGCKVIAVEAETRLVPLIKLTSYVNQWVDRVAVKNVAVYNTAGSLSFAYYTPKTGAPGQWLSMSMDQSAIEACKEQDDCQIQEIPMLPTHELVTSDILLLKIDVDGPEAAVTQGLFPALKRFVVQNILIEVCPVNWKSLIGHKEGVDVFQELVDVYGYHVILLNQVPFTSYEASFLSRCTLIEGVFRPKAYEVPPEMLRELLDPATAAINCKNVLFARNVKELTSSGNLK